MPAGIPYAKLVSDVQPFATYRQQPGTRGRWARAAERNRDHPATSAKTCILQLRSRQIDHRL